MGYADGSERFRSEYQFDLRDPDDRFTDKQFDRVHREILIWSLYEEVPCDITRTPAGFTVTVCHCREDGGAYGVSLNRHLSGGIFRELKSKGISLTYLG
jgi:hypothetical protein